MKLSKYIPKLSKDRKENRKLYAWAISAVLVWGVILGYSYQQDHKQLTTPVTTDTTLWSQSTPTANPVSPSNQSSKAPSSSSYPNCTTISTPPSTIYENASWLNKGTSQTIPGINGSVITCPGKAPITISPVNAIVYTGTYVPPEPVTYSAPTSAVSAGPSAAQLEYERQQRIQSCLRLLGARGAGGSSAAQQCYSIQ